MALLFMDGFDAGDAALKWSLFTSTSTGQTGRFGTGASIRINSTGGGFKVAKALPATSKLIVGFAYKSETLSQEIFGVSGDSGATNHINIASLGTGAIQIRRGSTAVATSSPSLILANQWCFIEVSVTISDTTGTVEVNVNGSPAASFTGDTKNGGTATTIDYYGFYYNGLNTGCFIDDVYACDATGPAPYNTFLSDVRVTTVVPTSAGSHTGFTPSSGANYTTVDELPYSSSDYVSATASGTRDTYTMGDLTGNYSVLAVQTNVVAKKLDAGGTAIRPAIVSGGTVYTGTSKALSSSDNTVSDLRTVDPATSTAWTVTSVNNLEAGMEIV